MQMPKHQMISMNTNTENNRLPPHFDLARLGLRDVAYVRPILLDGQQAFGVYAANGEEIGIAADMPEAVATAKSHDLMAIQVQ